MRARSRDTIDERASAEIIGAPSSFSTNEESEKITFFFKVEIVVFRLKLNRLLFCCNIQREKTVSKFDIFFSLEKKITNV